MNINNIQFDEVAGICRDILPANYKIMDFLANITTNFCYRSPLIKATELYT